MFCAVWCIYVAVVSSITHRSARYYTYVGRRTLKHGGFLADTELETGLRKIYPLDVSPLVSK